MDKRLYFHFISRTLVRHVEAANFLVLVEEVTGGLDHLASVTGISGAQFVLALEVDSHVVGLVGDMGAEGAGDPAVPRPARVGSHHIWARQVSY